MEEIIKCRIEKEERDRERKERISRERREKEEKESREHTKIKRPSLQRETRKNLSNNPTKIG